jgi:hypothetical protein
VNGPAILAGTGVTIQPSSGNITIQTTGPTGTISIDAPGTAGTGITIGNRTPATAATGYVVIGTKTSPGVLVRANLDTYVVSGAGTASCGTDLALSGGCSACPAGASPYITSITNNGTATTQATSVTCACSTGAATAYAVCLRRP